MEFLQALPLEPDLVSSAYLSNFHLGSNISFPPVSGPSYLELSLTSYDSHWEIVSSFLLLQDYKGISRPIHPRPGS